MIYYNRLVERKTYSDKTKAEMGRPIFQLGKDLRRCELSRIQNFWILVSLPIDDQGFGYLPNLYVE